MTDMLNTLLNFFRLDSGKEQANAVPFRLKNVIEILQTEFEPRAEAKDLTLRITRCSDIILMGDRNRLCRQTSALQFGRHRSNRFGENRFTGHCRTVFSKQAAPRSHVFILCQEPLPRRSWPHSSG